MGYPPFLVPSPFAFLMTAFPLFLAADLVLFGLARSGRISRAGIGRWFLFSSVFWPLGMLLFAGALGACLAFSMNLALALLQHRRRLWMIVRVVLLLVCLLCLMTDYGAANAKAHVVFDKANVGNLQREVCDYRDQHGAWPKDLEQVVASALYARDYLVSPGGFLLVDRRVEGPFALFPTGAADRPAKQRQVVDYLYAPPEGSRATEIVLATRPGRLWRNSINVAFAGGVVATRTEEQWLHDREIRAFFWKTRTPAGRHINGNSPAPMP